MAQSRDARVRQTMSGPIVELTGRLEQGLLWMAGGVFDFFYSYTFVASQSDELLKLRAKAYEVENLKARIDELLKERESILELNFAGQKRGLGKAIYANVVGRSGAPLSRIVRVDRGSLDGVRAESPVVAHGGAVGQVLSVSRHFSDVLLMTDASFAIDARVVGSDARGLLRGKTTAKEYVMELKDVDGLLSISAKDQIVTSGVNSIFPAGIPIGEVTSTYKTSDGLNVSAVVKPFVKMEHVNRVLIVLEVAENHELYSPSQEWVVASP